MQPIFFACIQNGFAYNTFCSHPFVCSVRITLTSFSKINTEFFLTNLIGGIGYDSYLKH